MSTWESGDATWGPGDGNDASANANDSWDGAPAAETGDFGGGGNDGEGVGHSGGDRACFNCGDIGHNKVDCPNPRVQRVPEGPCRRCGEEGHWSKECKGPMKVDRSHLADMSTDDAWVAILDAVKEEEIDDIKTAVQVYVKASPDTTYIDLEKAFRAQEVKLFLIAIERPLAATLTNMDLQGNMEKKYTVTYRLQWNPPRPRDREVWPKDVEENIERLADAGEVTNRGMPKCNNCNEVGHISKFCPQEKIEKENNNVIKCFNCDGEGHRIRDCPIPRVDKFACKNCGQSGHKVADCTEPRSAAGVECRKCGEMGHFSRDCPKGGDGGICRNCGGEGHFAKDCTEPRKIQCRNCDEFGHMSKDCPKPRDMSRVKCSNCQEMGHYKSRCPNPAVEEDAGGNGYGGNGGFDNGGGGGEFNTGGGDSFGGDDTGGGDTWGATASGAADGDAW